jgi:hypothetical protein
MKKLSVFLSHFNPSHSTLFLPIIILGFEQPLKIMLHNLSEIKLMQKQSSLLLQVIKKKENDKIALINQQLQFRQTRLPLFESHSKQF